MGRDCGVQPMLLRTGVPSDGLALELRDAQREEK